jgi:hypothetical protein
VKIYLSCSSLDLSVARLAIAELQEAGHTITYDWTKEFDKEIEYDPRRLAARAWMIINNVTKADAVVGYMTPSVISTTRCYFEIGAALGKPKPILVCEEHGIFDHFFQNHPWLLKVDTFGMLLVTLREWEEAFEARGRQWVAPPKVPLLKDLFNGETGSGLLKE